ncbi:uncharacterized protein N0V89_012047 [Didymosphaeria variabile]|uniref:Uncharacterized protein n=1 Tax=Didymosphaeria variabile TaxID=1932322 RepID=A0A9W8XAW3_9PLEO|nr:uncharacterized protein N0V89_012047 [Didymosphaeria variabile]KAJ4345911.1 hypothetical protein N0V89_012047 [Didymosphaeria variabile]
MSISKLVTYRVFGPFLFSLGRRYDKADSLFLSMSNHIRDKSTRKEAIWRQQTLLAAFTSSGAKQRINTAAGTVVEEIVNAIKHFADPREEEGIKIAVKRIVKLAAETWRFARLEREMISATMPAIHDEDHDFTRPKFWPSHRPEGSPIASLVGTEKPSDEQPQMLLRLFPVIYREPKHENFRDEVENENPDEGCIYHYGLALYDDAETVVQRKEELQAAGLPPTTNAASPTAADFPPPLLPAPRTSLPPTPTVEKASIRSKSPPPLPESSKDTTYTRPPPEPTKDAASTRPASTVSINSGKDASYARPPPKPTRDVASTRPASPASIKSGKTSVRSRTPPPVPPKRTSIRSKSSLSVNTVKSSARSSAPPSATNSCTTASPTNPSEAPPLQKLHHLNFLIHHTNVHLPAPSTSRHPTMRLLSQHPRRASSAHLQPLWLF